MNIRLYEGNFVVENDSDDFVIQGDEERGYEVLLIVPEDKDEVVYENKSLEKCLTWVLNS